MEIITFVVLLIVARACFQGALSILGHMLGINRIAEPKKEEKSE